MTPHHARQTYRLGQSADRGDGCYLNPILPGDWPDPSVLRIDGDYYLTHSSFNFAPGLLIWHSTDLVNWRPLVYALSEYDGDVWAPELVCVGGVFYIYYKTTGGNHVIHADTIEGPWSKPVDLGLPHIDPGHITDEHGRRYLHLSGGHAVALTDDGLAPAGPVEKVFDPWPIPEHWRIEGCALEGPKLLFRDGWYHMLVAQGGTAGPATSHMVISARSRSPLGPWEYSPHNPIVRTASRADRWHSRGHGTLIDTPDGRWFIIYHAYEKHYQTLGRQTLLEPIEWTADGWPRVPDHVDCAAPIPMPLPSDPIGGMSLDDDFSGDQPGVQWRMFGPMDMSRLSFDGGLVMQGRGQTPADSPPLCLITAHHAYRIEADVSLLDDQAVGGIALFYNHRCFAGLGLSSQGLQLVRHDMSRPRTISPARRDMSLSIVNDHHEVDFYVRAGHQGPWQRLRKGIEVGGYRHNTFGGFLSLRAALWAGGDGRVRFEKFRYQPLD